MSALAAMFVASVFSASAFAQMNYAPYSGQPAYVTQPAAQQYGQQYYAYAPQQTYATQPSYATSVAPGYAAAAPVYTGTAAPRYVSAAPSYTGTAAPRYAAAPQVYAQNYAAAGAPAYAAPAPAPAYVVPAPTAVPALSSESHGGFLEAIFGGPTLQAHVYQPFAPQYQTPVTQPTVINNPVPAYTPSSQGDMSNYPIDPQFQRQVVDYRTDEKPGTIVIDTPSKFLYLVEDGGKALRYGIGVGRPGFTWSGTHEITAKREWPDWYPPSDMLARRPDLPRYMPGGLENPLGSRAMYLGSTLYRIHGSNEPWTIGTNVSSGCIRMRNADVEDLYDRVKVGTKVVVI
jgi:lipoprotein-anchoring transpeptidase ErfK/SrfK